ncbi:MAG: MarR family transcriptional regulator, partial [Ignavibacteriae bacterium]
EHEKDTRAKCVFLTEKGRKRLQKAIEIKTKANELFFNNLTDKKKFSEQLRLLIE